MMGTATKHWAGQPRNQGSILGGIKRFFFSKPSIPAPETIQPPYQYVPGFFPVGKA